VERAIDAEHAQSRQGGRVTLLVVPCTSTTDSERDDVVERNGDFLSVLLPGRLIFRCFVSLASGRSSGAHENRRALQCADDLVCSGPGVPPDHCECEFATYATCTKPCVPSTVTVCPSWNSAIAPRTDLIAGSRISRAVTVRGTAARRSP
jgi:hypothetical protein